MPIEPTALWIVGDLARSDPPAWAYVARRRYGRVESLTFEEFFEAEATPWACVPYLAVLIEPPRVPESSTVPFLIVSRVDRSKQGCGALGWHPPEEENELLDQLDDLLTSHDFLRSRIAELQRRLTEIGEMVMEKEAELQELYHTMSHEIRTPLTSASEFVNLLLEEVLGPINEQQRDALRISRESHRRLNHILSDILTGVAIARHRFEIDRRPMDLAKSVAEIVHRFEYAATQRSLQLRVETDACPVEGDARALTRVIHALVDNAIKFSPCHGVVEVSARHHRDEGVIVLEVVDQADAIPEDEIHRVVRRGYQIHSDADELAPGLGLGLYLVNEIARLHGGRTEIIPGLRGNLVRVVLPSGQPKATPRKEAHATAYLDCR